MFLQRCIRLNPFGSDSSARYKVICVFSGKVGAKSDEFSEALVRNVVDDFAPLALGYDKPAPSHAGEVVGYTALRNAEDRD